MSCLLPGSASLAPAPAFPAGPDTDGPDEEALRRLRARAALTPTDPAVHRALAQAYSLIGQKTEAHAEQCAALALESGMPLVLFQLGTAYLKAGQSAAAAKWYRLTLMIDPDLAAAHQNLACILENEGLEAEARIHRERAFRNRPLVVEPAPSERRRVLVLAASGMGNVPLEWLLPRQTNTRLTWFLEYADPASIASLPPHDLVINAIGDPDMSGPGAGTMQHFLRSNAARLLNHPDQVALTRRDRLPALLGGIPGVEVPPVLRVEHADEAADALARREMAFPLLLRPAGVHGGKDLVRLERPDALRAGTSAGADAWYLCPFRDYRSPDGYWRKYRFIFVDRRPYPYHLAISPDWLVHYVTADMLSDPRKCAEERRFLKNPDAVIGARGMAALRAIGERLDLDYAGVDFSILPDGTLLVFEANATMLVHPEKQAEFRYKNAPVQRILDAFESMLSTPRQPDRG